MPDIYFAISIDVEPDCTPTWHYSSPLAFQGVCKGIGEVLQPLFNQQDVTPTYLINNVVLEDNGSVSVLKSLHGKFELGTHLHPEFIPPQKNFESYAGKKGEANCCFYPPQIEFEKIRNITELFKKQFGYSPTSFRAGRFSAGVNTMESLRSLGYYVDSSVTPHVNWCDKTRQEPVDYRGANELPYWIAKENYLEEGHEEKQILEVPVTIDLQRRFLKGQQIKWLRPVYSSSKDFTGIINSYLKRYQNKTSIVFNMMFHNVEVLPGLNPYVQSETEAKQYLDQLQYFIEYMHRLKGRSVGLSELFHLL
jgi:hypothetical protein